MLQECIQHIIKENLCEQFFRTLKKKIYEDMTSISKNMYIDKLDDILNT